MLNIVFMGTPDFAKTSLEALVESGHNILTVVTNPDKPKGRGMKMVLTPVKEYAISKGLDVKQPIKIKNNEDFIKEIKQLKPDLICVVAYGKIIPEEILNIPRYGAINVHGSLLPKYRGAAPIQWAVLNGDKYTGVTTIYMDKGMDTGDIILKKKVEIGEDETTGELWERLSKIGADLLVETIDRIENKTAPRQKQENDYTLAPMLNKEIGKIDWENKTALQIKNLVRGLNPIMGAYCFVNGKKVKFWRVELLNQDEIDKIDAKNYVVGTVVLSNEKQGLYIKTKDSIISVLEIQGENSKRMPIKEFLRGNKIEVGLDLKKKWLKFKL